MPQFRLKPTNIEARKFISNGDADLWEMKALVEWIIDRGGRADCDGVKIRLRTHASWSTAHVGDYIFQNPDGTFGVLREGDFFRHYEYAEDAGSEAQIDNCETSGDLGFVNGRLSNHLRIVVSDKTRIRNCVLIAD